MIAVWIPVTVVPTSSATVAIETFITDASSIIRNCAAASVSRTSVEARETAADAVEPVVMATILSESAVEATESATSAKERRRRRHALDRRAK